MIKRYPYKLYSLSDSAGTHDEDGIQVPGPEFDENGFPIILPDAEPTEVVIQPGETFISECRDQPANAGDILTLDSGDRTNFKYVVYLPYGDYPIQTNTIIQVRDQDGHIRLYGPVQRVHKNQINVKLWV